MMPKCCNQKSSLQKGKDGTTMPYYTIAFFDTMLMCASSILHIDLSFELVEILFLNDFFNRNETFSRIPLKY